MDQVSVFGTTVLGFKKKRFEYMNSSLIGTIHCPDIGVDSDQIIK